MNHYLQKITERKIPSFRGICYQCNFYIDAYSDNIVEHLLGLPLETCLIESVPKRKAEFVAGRYLAKQALLLLGSKLTFVGISPNRAPQWPKNFVGSISHSQEFAICAVARCDEYSKIGIDVENCFSAQVAQDIIGQIFHESEYAFLDQYKNPDPLILTLIFSAKESLFKALYPEVGYYFGFETARTKMIDWHRGLFTLELVNQLTPALPVGACFEGAFVLEDQQVFTMISCLNKCQIS